MPEAFTSGASHGLSDAAPAPFGWALQLLLTPHSLRPFGLHNPRRIYVLLKRIAILM